jgi:hypothetical protein
MNQSMRSSAEATIHMGQRARTASPSWSKSPQEGDAFLVRVRMWEIALLMGGGL